jgi:hypothetical protein
MKDDELRKLLDGATPGPWRPGASTFFAGLDGPACMRVYTDHPPTEFELTGDNLAANARLIAAAPALAREVIALREAAGELADAAEQSYQAAHDYRVTSNAASAEASLRADQEFRTALATLRAVLGESE